MLEGKYTRILLKMYDENVQRVLNDEEIAIVHHAVKLNTKSTSNDEERIKIVNHNVKLNRT